jgi:hypothetical protein
MIHHHIRHLPSSYFFEIHFNMIHLCIGLTSGLFPSYLRPTLCMHFSSLSCVLHVSHNPDYIFWKLQIATKICIHTDTSQIFMKILPYMSSHTESTKPSVSTGVGECFLLRETFAHSRMKVSAFIIHIRIIVEANFKTYLRLKSWSSNTVENLNTRANSRVPLYFKTYRLVPFTHFHEEVSK